MDATECVDDILESTEVDHDISIDPLSSDLRNLLSEELDPDLVADSHTIECVDLACGTVSLRICDKEVTGDRNECHISTITVDTREHD